MILAHYKPLHCTVKVLAVFNSGSRQRVLIRTLDQSEPWTRFTMGGPVNTDSAFVSRDLIADAWQAADSEQQPQTTGRRSRLNGTAAPTFPHYTPEDQAELAPFFPTRTRGRSVSAARGGMNND